MPEPTRAIVLGGGGVTGIAWEIGVLTGLAAAGVDLAADAVIGTSAGAFAGAALAAGADLENQYARQHGPAEHEHDVVVGRRLRLAWAWPFVRGFGDPERIGAAFGRLAGRLTPLVGPEERRDTVAARLATETWPATLRVSVIDARSGALEVLDASCGHPLADVVSASGAVPGISPPVDLGGRRYIDGGMVSAANVLLARGHDRVLVVAPIEDEFGGMPTVADDVAELRRAAEVELIVPDAVALAAIGPNRFDPSRRAGAAVAGRAQGRSAAARVRRLFA